MRARPVRMETDGGAEAGPDAGALPYTQVAGLSAAAGGSGQVKQEPVEDGAPTLTAPAPGNGGVPDMVTGRADSRSTWRQGSSRATVEPTRKRKRATPKIVSSSRTSAAGGGTPQPSAKRARPSDDWDGAAAAAVSNSGTYASDGTRIKDEAEEDAELERRVFNAAPAVPLQQKARAGFVPREEPPQAAAPAAAATEVGWVAGVLDEIEPPTTPVAAEKGGDKNATPRSTKKKGRKSSKRTPVRGAEDGNGDTTDAMTPNTKKKKKKKSKKAATANPGSAAYEEIRQQVDGTLRALEEVDGAATRQGRRERALKKKGKGEKKKKKEAEVMSPGTPGAKKKKKKKKKAKEGVVAAEGVENIDGPDVGSPYGGDEQRDSDGADEDEEEPHTPPKAAPRATQEAPRTAPRRVVRAVAPRHRHAAHNVADDLALCRRLVQRQRRQALLKQLTGGGAHMHAAADHTSSSAADSTPVGPRGYLEFKILGVLTRDPGAAELYHSFEAGTYRIGRKDRITEMCVTLPGISGHHATLRVTEQGMYITDVGSTNKTFVNVTREGGLARATPLEPFKEREVFDGDVLNFGTTTARVVVYDRVVKEVKQEGGTRGAAAAAGGSEDSDADADSSDDDDDDGDDDDSDSNGGEKAADRDGGALAALAADTDMGAPWNGGAEADSGGGLGAGADVPMTDDLLYGGYMDGMDSFA